MRNVYGDPTKVDETLVDRHYQLTLREGNRLALVQRFQQSARGRDAARIQQLLRISAHRGRHFRLIVDGISA